MLTTREFRWRRGPLMPSRRVCGAPGGPARRGNVPRGTWYGLRHHACLLSSGFYRGVYASSASERVSSFHIADNDDDEEEED
ncbi:hypothetical protein ALC60_08344 [Trachymyrmex zeteki]|uniref:Uncharacterized protein n=1 Tax=Mycetomoellerius zeteki TaxID=64791 RepID=A0A151WX47_9HYME|nr:hypothetical protein ALC60_08344 [Trachymyrmex zeteki]